MMNPEIGRVCCYITADDKPVMATIKGVLVGDSYQHNEINLDYQEGKFGIPVNAVPYSEEQLPGTWSYLF